MTCFQQLVTCDRYTKPQSIICEGYKALQRVYHGDKSLHKLCEANHKIDFDTFQVIA